MLAGRQLAIPIAVIAAVMLLLLAPLNLERSALARALENASHAPLFAAVGIASIFWLRRLGIAGASRSYSVALLFAVALGGLGELAQMLTASRHADWVDLANDSLGAAAGLSLFALFVEQPRLSNSIRVAAYIVAFSCIAVVTAPIGRLSYMYWQRWDQLPALANWDSKAGHYFVMSASSQLRVLPFESGFNRKSELALYVKPRRVGRWVGVTIDEPWPKWVGYSQLVVQVSNPNERPIELTLRVNDRLYNHEFDDRFNRRFVVAPHAEVTLATDLSDIATAAKSRRIDLNNISLVMLYQDADKGAYPFYLRSVRLQP